MAPLSGMSDGGDASMVLISGAGRSGTSTIAGVLRELGYYVPQPEVAVDESNPRGFFEPAWVVDFHKRVLGELDVRTVDSRPDAADVAVTVSADSQHGEELRAWLARQRSEAQRLVIKDPRTVWLLDVWLSVAKSLDIETTLLSMLRHPAEVIGSRAVHYLSELPPEIRKTRETTNAAAWVNVNLVNELRTRQHRRSFVRYDKLVEDWRAELRVVAEQLDLAWPVDLDSPAADRVDKFIDPTLRRSREVWEDIAIPQDLRELAEELWGELTVLADEPHNADAIARIDEIRAAYVSMHEYAVAFARHQTQSEVTSARRALRARLQHQHKQHVEKVRRRMRKRLRESRQQEPGRRGGRAKSGVTLRRLLGKAIRRPS